MGDLAGVSCALEGWGSNTGSPGSLRAAGRRRSMKRAVGALFALFAQQIDDNVRNGRGRLGRLSRRFLRTGRLGQQHWQPREPPRRRPDELDEARRRRALRSFLLSKSTIMCATASGCVNKPVAVNPKRPILTPFHTTSIFQDVEIP